MKKLFLLLFLLPALEAHSIEDGKDDPCVKYTNFKKDEAYKTFKDMQIRSGELGIELAKFQRDGVPDEDPKSSAVAVELGNLLGGMYQFCSCNIDLSSTKDCQAHKQMMEAIFQQRNRTQPN